MTKGKDLPRGPGRPSLPETERKDATLRVRLTDADKARIEAKAEAAGLTASEWARMALLRSLKRSK